MDLKNKTTSELEVLQDMLKFELAQRKSEVEIPVMIKKHSKWSKLLDATQAYKKFNAPVRNKEMINILAPSTTLAFAISQFTDLSEKKSLRICIAGAGLFDADNDGDHFKILPTLIGIEKIHIDLVGFDVHKDKVKHPYTLKSNIGESVNITLWEMSIGQYLEKINDKPDVLMLNHPGFEKYASSWFVDDDGIALCVDAGVHVLGCSYGEDEAEYDSYFALSFGFKVSEPINNPFHIDMSSRIKNTELSNLPGFKSALKGSMDWGRQVWSIEGRTARGVDDELYEVLDLGTRIKGTFLDDCHDIDVLLNKLHGQTDDRKYEFVVLKFNPLLLYILGKDVVVDEDGDVVIEDVLLDRSYLKNAPINSFQATIVIGLIYRDYSDEIKSLNNDNKDDSFEGSHLMNMLMGVDSRNMTKGEEDIELLITDSAWDELSSTDPSLLKGWRNTNNQSLFHISALLGELKLYEIAKKADVYIFHRDNDGFALLDVCAETNASSILLNLLEDFDLDLDSADLKGLTAIHRAHSYSNKGIADILVKNGAKSNPVNIFGVSAQQMGVFSGAFKGRGKS